MFVCMCLFLLFLVFLCSNRFVHLIGWLVGWFAHVNFLFRNRFYLIYKQNHKRIKKVIVSELNKWYARAHGNNSDSNSNTTTATITIIINTLRYKKRHDSIGKKVRDKRTKAPQKASYFLCRVCVQANSQTRRIFDMYSIETKYTLSEDTHTRKQ